MGIDHVVDLECAAKSALGAEGIVGLLKSRSRGEMVLAMAREQGDERPPSEITFKVQVIGPGGEPEARDVDVQSLLDQSAALDEHAGGCAGCPANLGGEPFGCVGYIRYPIEAATEAWLLDRLPDSLGTTAGQLLMRALADFEWDGAYAAELRSQGDMFFENDEPLSCSWGDALTVTSNQVFDMLFGLGHLGSSHCRMLALFFGVIPHDTEIDALLGLSADDLAAVARGVDLGPTDGSQQIEEMASALRAVALAAAIDQQLLIDG